MRLLSFDFVPALWFGQCQCVFAELKVNWAATASAGGGNVTFAPDGHLLSLDLILLCTIALRQGDITGSDAFYERARRNRQDHPTSNAGEQREIQLLTDERDQDYKRQTANQ